MNCILIHNLNLFLKYKPYLTISYAAENGVDSIFLTV